MICNLGVVGSNPTRGALSEIDEPSITLYKGEYQSGQMGQTVNLLVYTFGGSNPSSPTLRSIRQGIRNSETPNWGFLN